MVQWFKAARRTARRLEAPTWILAFTIYGGWLALTVCWNTLPVWVVLPAAAWLCAWHMSLQHELMHGHPTRSERINGLLAWPPLNLWLPYPLYRLSHLKHHQAELTDPFEDPESTYMTPAAWARAGRVRRGLHGACNTLSGRLLLGPACTIVLFGRSQLRRTRDGAFWRVWLAHASGVALVLGWVCGVCRIDLLGYVACFVYPGAALILLRSLVEHHAAERQEDRTAVVERAGLLGLLYLNNNLHVLHHERPSVPWYELPAQWRLARARMISTRRGPVYRGYRDVAARYAWQPHHPGPHPATQP